VSEAATSRVPVPVEMVCRHLLALLDEQCPGQVTAFYLVGSVALGDYRHGQSDIDFVALLRGPPDIAALSAVHAALAKRHLRPHCDGIYIGDGPLDAPGPRVREGHLDPTSRDERHPVTWLTLADSGIALRGPAADPRWAIADRHAAVRHSADNLATYWSGWRAARVWLFTPAGLTLLSDEAITWGVLGVSRLHATIATGRIVSKSAGGDHAAVRFPAFARVIAEAQRIRCDPTAPPLYRSRLARRREALAFMATLIGSVEA
jgi:hypothetical protein